MIVCVSVCVSFCGSVWSTRSTARYRVWQGSEMKQDRPLQRLHQMGWHRPVAGEVLWVYCLWHRYTQDVFQSSGILISFRLKNKCSTMTQSWSAQGLRSLELMPPGPAAFLALILWSWFLTWIFVSRVGDWGQCAVQVGLLGWALESGWELSVVRDVRSG